MIIPVKHNLGDIQILVQITKCVVPKRLIVLNDSRLGEVGQLNKWGKGAFQVGIINQYASLIESGVGSCCF